MDDKSLNEKINAVAALVREAGRIVVFTGAGVSTESGIPDFRSPGGIWTKYDPMEFTIGHFMSSAETRRMQWKILIEAGLMKAQAKPNKAHYAIFELERMGKLSCVVTQNIDNLHQMAGNHPTRVYELHGTMKYVICMDCGERYAAEKVLAGHDFDSDPPVCRNCRGILKPDVILFGEALPQYVFEDAVYHAEKCNLMMVIGSSLVVYPAAQVPFKAKKAGAKYVIINREATPYDYMADVVINASAGEVMERIIEEVRRKT